VAGYYNALSAFFFSFRFGQVIQYNKNGGNRERKVLASRLQAGRKCRGGVGAELHFNYYHNVQSELDSFYFPARLIYSRAQQLFYCMESNSIYPIAGKKNSLLENPGMD
jgi:hypothetical protein